MAVGMSDAHRHIWLAGLLASFLAAGCPPERQDQPDDSEPELADEVYGEMGEPMPAASDRQRETFERGEKVAQRRFSPQEGLGPTFNVSFCASCHEQPVAGGSSPRYRNFFLVANELPDGTINFLGKQGVHRQFDTGSPARRPTPDEADLLTTRNAIPFFGVGALAEIPAEEILERADPNDEDGDGISGRVNLEGRFVGRFGRKAQTASLVGFVRGPLFNHLGVTTNPMPDERKAELPVPSDSDAGTPVSPEQVRGALLPEEICIHCQATPPSGDLSDDDGVEDPELGQEAVFDLVSWTMLLAAPEPDEPTERTGRGEQLFTSIGCADCHVPALEGPRGRVEAYTDLLLHEMGEELADGIQQGRASGSEFRTQPLWGVAATEPYLHDGRADTLDEAIRWHGGEAERARRGYEELSEEEQQAVIAFLRSLGGADRDSEGLIPPDQSAPSAGEFGGAQRPLQGDARERFQRGRRLFDSDFALEEGLGPEFNGDSCRACHFDPTVGGSGPVGLNVTRQGHVDSSGEFTAPPEGTLLPRFAIDFASRPAAHEQVNTFELRQPPPLFGLGLLNRVPDEELERHADPMDVDGDGIAGRVSRPHDGRAGRFGWKASFPTLEDFVRDALSNESGLTVPAGEEFVAGRTSDADGVEDPEFAGEDYDDLLYYSRMLGPPPGDRAPADEPDAGEAVFHEVGCAACHVPTLETTGGEKIHAYTDLLLHRVAPPEASGIEGADAGMGEFRTPPLWGIAQTDPYMHDGMAGTLDVAIRRHAGEASDAAEAYAELSDDRRASLLNFLRSL